VSDAFALEFEGPSGEHLDFGWDTERLEQLDGGLGPQTPWLLDGELDWDEIELIRVLSARFDDGRLLGVAALRPAGAEGHGDDLVVGAIASADGNIEGLEETLLSVEYAADGLPRRAGLELYRGEGTMPLRAAGDATATESERDGSVERTSVALAMRLAGTTGHGRLDLLRIA
jgi:hypothetical protein